MSYLKQLIALFDRRPLDINIIMEDQDRLIVEDEDMECKKPIRKTWEQDGQIKT